MKRSILITLNSVEKRLNFAFFRCLFFTIFILISQKAASPVTEFISIPATGRVNVYDRLIKAVVQVESRGDNLAFNVEEGAVGAFQIRMVRLLDYNKKTGKNYSMEDCYNFDISKEIFLYYATRISHPNFEKIAKRWNGSGRLTIDYWKRVQEYL